MAMWIPGHWPHIPTMCPWCLSLNTASVPLLANTWHYQLWQFRELHHQNSPWEKFKSSLQIRILEINDVQLAVALERWTLEQHPRWGWEVGMRKSIQFCWVAEKRIILHYTALSLTVCLNFDCQEDSKLKPWEKESRRMDGHRKINKQTTSAKKLGFTFCVECFVWSFIFILHV